MHRNNIDPRHHRHRHDRRTRHPVRVSPAFKTAATDISLSGLVVLVLSGLLGALIAPLLDLWSEPGPQREKLRSDDPCELITVGRTSQGGDLR